MVENVEVLGTIYSVFIKNATEDKLLNTMDGYCDRFAKMIVISDCKDKDFDKEAYREECIRKIFRHEVIHAFLFESGLQENSWGESEEIVDWFASMFPKLEFAFSCPNTMTVAQFKDAYFSGVPISDGSMRMY